MGLPKAGGDYPLDLLVAVKTALFRVTADPELEDARAILERVDSYLAANQPAPAAKVKAPQDTGDWHTTGSPVPYKPADGQW